MVTEAVWEQVAALPFADQLDLAERIVAEVPRVPDSQLVQLSSPQLRDLLDASERELEEHPETVRTAGQAIAELRARLHL